MSENKERKLDVIAITHVNVDGTRNEPGSKISLPESTAKDLFDRGIVESPELKNKKEAEEIKNMSDSQIKSKIQKIIMEINGLESGIEIYRKEAKKRNIDLSTDSEPKKETKDK